MRYGILFVTIFLFVNVYAQQSWEVASYPDEKGWVKRNAGVIDRIAGKEYGVRSMARSVCPDTGLPVLTWAVEGEDIISPYTGRKYKQGPTGYFGPKARNAEGEIISFGGDPLKYDLDPATARILKNPWDIKARAFLSVWGNMIQQYHFGACNWARFYGLNAGEMGLKWQKKFQKAVGEYAESRRPSDGAREHDPLPRPYNLVGFPEEKEGVLGGGFANGGTENHKTMWRTSALVYAGLFPEDALISGYSPDQVKEIVPDMFHDYFRKILKVGNGEYDSHIYYPHSIYAFLNLYDFATDPLHREMAKFILDYYLITYGLKCVDNTIAGAQKRGYLSNPEASEMETCMWAWSGFGSKNMSEANIHLHQATAGYRPNKIIYNILNNKIAYPFEAYMARPTYHMNVKNAFQESFFRSESYALGNVTMTMVDNPNQQVVWSLVAEGENGPLGFGGQQPYRLAPAGHSQYSQTAQSRRSLILISGNSGEKPPRGLTDEENFRYENTKEKLKFIKFPGNPTIESAKAYFSEARLASASWLYIPKRVTRVIEAKGRIFIEANETFLVVFPLSDYEWIRSEDWQFIPSDSIKDIHGYLNEYMILSVVGEKSGYIIDTAEKSKYSTLDAFMKAVNSEHRLYLSDFKKKGIVEYRNLEGDVLKMQYVDTGLRANVWLNQEAFDYENWAGGGVYDSPYVKVKDGCMYVTDGEDGYKVDYTGERPVYNKWEHNK